jgi:hypothetical protein
MSVMREEGLSVAEEIEWFVGIDWANQSHQVCLVDARGECLDLQAAINAYLAEHNASPKPFVWTKSADAILAKLDRLPVPSV